MKAAYIENYGQIEDIKVDQLPEPEPGDQEVIVEVKAASLNHLDLWVLKGRPGMNLNFPHILGSDAAGVIIETGPGVHGFEKGDEVIVNPGLNCGCCEHCYNGQQSQCLNYGVIGLSRPGTFGQKIAVPFYSLRKKPSHLSFNQAAALPLVFLTAWRMLYTRGRLQPGQTVLIHGIGGGVAQAALTLAKLASAETIVTSSSNDKLRQAVQLGADHTLNYTMIDVAESVREITHGRGVDLVIDSVGASTWQTSFKAVRKAGKIVLCGVTTGAEASTNLQALYWNQVDVLGSTMGSHEDFRKMLKAVEQNKLTPNIDSTHPLDDIKDAMNKMQDDRQFGKLVITVSD